jgi:predicted MFS family arabinose efflux permease
MVEEPRGAGPRTHLEGRSFVAVVFFIAVGIFATTFAQPQALGKIPLQNFLKGDLKVTPEQMAFFFFACSFFWYLTPIAGILTDAFPLFKTRRRHYALASTVLAAASWLALAVVPRTYNAVLIAAIVVNLFMVMMATVTGAVLVEVGQNSGSVGRLTAVRQFAYNVSSLVQGPLGGLLATGALGLVCGVNSIFLLIFFPAAYFVLKEKRVEVKRHEALATAKAQVLTVLSSRAFWWALIFILLFYFAPGFTTLLYYRQTDVLHLDQPHIGYLGSFGGLGGILGAVSYGAVVRRFDLRALLIAAIVTAAVATYMYLAYDNFTAAIVIDFSNGFFFGFAEVAFIDLAARATPAGCEGFGYSLLLSGRALALYGADYLGSMLADRAHWSWNSMVILNGTSTAVVIVLLPFVPKAILASKDRPHAEMAN